MSGSRSSHYLTTKLRLSHVLGVTNSGENNSHCGGRSVGHGTVYSGGEESNGEGQSVDFSGEDVSNYGGCHI